MALSMREKRLLASIDRDKKLMVESLCMDREYLVSRLPYVHYMPLEQLGKFHSLCKQNYKAVVALRKEYVELHPDDKLPKILFHDEWEELSPLMQLFTTQTEFHRERKVIRHIYKRRLEEYLEENRAPSVPASASTGAVAASSVKSAATCAGCVPSVPNTKPSAVKSITLCNKTSPPPAHVVQRDLIAAVNKVASYSSRPTPSQPIPTRAQTLDDAWISGASTDRTRVTSVVQKDTPYKTSSLTSVAQTSSDQKEGDRLLSMMRALNTKADKAGATADAASDRKVPSTFMSTELKPQVIAFLNSCKAHRLKEVGGAECEPSTATRRKTFSAE